MPTLPDDTRFDFLVVIPTIGEAAVLGPTVRQVVRHMEGTRTHLVLAVNPVDPPAALATINELQANLAPPDGCSITVWMDGGPVGFGAAVNEGLLAGTRDGLPRTTIVLNDDVTVTAGWQRYLRNALDTATVRMPGEPPGPDGHRPDRPSAAYGRIGLSGPASDEVAGIQRIGFPAEEAARAAADPDTYAAWFRQANVGNFQACDFLSGFCLAIDRECLRELIEWAPNDVPGGDGANRPERPLLFDERFGIGGFEDNDLCVRAERKQWRCVVAGDLYVHHRGHQTLDKHFAGQRRGMANRSLYYEKWRPFTQKTRVVACYRFKAVTANDLYLMRASIQRAAQIVDAIAVVLTGNPLEIGDAWDWPIASGLVLDTDGRPALDAAGRPQYDVSKSGFKPYDWALLQACDKADAPTVAHAFELWMVAVLKEATGPLKTGDVRCTVWDGAFNERDERNAAIALAETLKPDWIMSVDGDEVIEDRIDRAWLERLCRHPDPMVRSWDVGWWNHWDATRLCRIDHPWSDGHRYASGMRGFRIWRSAGRRIVSGNEIGFHCGNCPDHDAMAKRVSSLRFRHYGYLRRKDRERKHAWYRRMDRQPDRNLVGGSGDYAHLVAEEGMLVAPYWVETGIGLTMLAYSGEDHEDIARWLDALHGLVDHVAIVWTDAALDEPGPAMKEIGDAFGVEWVRHQNDDDLAACRNAGLDVLRKRKNLGWALVLDPDEGYQDSFAACVSFRRMAECTNSYGFIIRFGNQRPPETGEQPTLSEALRFVRLDPDGVMRYDGRVHEGFEKSLHRLTDGGIHPQVRTAPYVCINRGLAGSPEAMERKLHRYTRMLMKELVDNPLNAHAWMSLGLQYANEGRDQEALECFGRSCQRARDAYLPFKELALWHMRVAKQLYGEVLRNCTPSHEYAKIAQDMKAWLDRYAPDQPQLGLALHKKSDGGSWIGPIPYSSEEWARLCTGETISASFADSPMRVVVEAPAVEVETSNGHGTTDAPLDLAAETSAPV